MSARSRPGRLTSCEVNDYLAVASRGRDGAAALSAANCTSPMASAGLFDLNPAQQVLLAYGVEEGRVVGSHMAPNDIDDLVISIASGHKPAFASDQLRHRSSHSALITSVLQDVAVTLVTPHRALRIQICGPLAIERDGERLEARLPGRQGRLLFTYLVVHRHRQVPRDELAEALWREPNPAAVEARLNPLLSKLRRVFGADAVDGRSSLRLHLADAWVDIEAAAEAIHRAESSVAQHDWVRAWGPALIALFVAERDFFPGEDAPWIDEVRRQLDVLHVRALECYAAAGLGIGGAELAGAVRDGRKLIRVAPLRESGYRCLMEALTAQDNIAEALRVYGELSDRLRDQLGISPGPATRELYERLLAAT
jgi:DNA-binding SARP family transcriptional activator